VSGDDREDRPRRSWSEIDKLRDKPRERRDERRPRGAAAEALSRQAAQQYPKKLDTHLYAKGGKGTAGERHAAAVRAAHGTPALTDACRAHLEALGAPADAQLLAAFLDARDRDVQLAALRAIAEQVRAGALALGAGLRAQLRTLARGLDDAVAEAAEDALAASGDAPPGVS
jgi:hypothetical protein